MFIRSTASVCSPKYEVGESAISCVREGKCLGYWWRSVHREQWRRTSKKAKRSFFFMIGSAGAFKERRS